MDNQEQSRHITVVNREKYSAYKEQLISLYHRAFTTGEHAQYMTSGEAESALNELIEAGNGLMWLSENQPVALIFWTSLKFDGDYPVVAVSHLKPDESAYIAEVVVHDKFRGKGIATKLIESALNKISKKYTQVIIRVWDKNQPAVSLYFKLGFQKLTSIIQTKQHSPDDFFEMRKIYMIKKLK